MSKKLLTNLLASGLFLFSIFVPATTATSTTNIDKTAPVLSENHDENHQLNPQKMKNLTLSSSAGFNSDSKKIMVISDVHIMSEKLLKKTAKHLMITCKKTENFCRKPNYCQELANNILAENPDVVLVSGDLIRRRTA